MFGRPFDRKTNHACSRYFDEALIKIKHWRLTFSFNSSTFSLFLHHSNARNVVQLQGNPKFLKFSRRACPRTPLQVCFFTTAHTHPPPPSTKNPGYAPVLLLLWFKLSPVRVSSFKRAFIFTPPAPNNLRPIVRFYNIVEAKNTQRLFGHWREPNSKNRF